MLSAILIFLAVFCGSFIICDKVSKTHNEKRTNLMTTVIAVVLVLGIKYYAAVDFYKLALLFSFLASLMPKQRTIDVSTTLARISHTLACPGVDISTDSAPKK